MSLVFLPHTQEDIPHGDLAVLQCLGRWLQSVCLPFMFPLLLLAMLLQVVPEESLELSLEPGRCASLLETLTFSFFPSFDFEAGSHSVALAGL